MSIIPNFVQLLRLFNIRVSISEAIDAQKVFSLPNVATNRTKLRIALKSCLIKNKNNFLLFDSLFNQYFLLISIDQAQEKTPVTDQHILKLNKQFPNLRAISYGKIKEFYNEIQENRNKRLSAPNSIGFGDSGGGINISSELLVSINNKFRLNNFSGFSVQPTESEIKLAIDLLDNNNDFQAMGNNNLNATDNAKKISQDFKKLNTIPIQDIPRINIDPLRLKELLLELGRRLASKKKRKIRQANHGKRLHFRRIFRKSLQVSGLPIDLVFKRKRIVEPELVILNDVSGSTRRVAEWFFIIAFTASSAFKKVRVFEFDNSTVEISSSLKKKTIQRALKERQEIWGDVLRLRGYHSDYNSSLQQFFEIIKTKRISKKATIIIQGDCRDYEGSWIPGGIPESSLWIRKMKNISKRVIILNPESIELWDAGDSVVSFFASEGAELYSVSNINEFTRFVFTL